MPSDEGFELVDQLCTTAEFELGVDAALERGQQPFRELRDFQLSERLELEIPERLATPQGDRGAQQLCALLRPRRLRLGDEPVEPRKVEPLGVDAEDISSRFEPQPVMADRLPEAGDVVLQRRDGGPRRPPAPEFV